MIYRNRIAHVLVLCFMVLFFFITNTKSHAQTLDDACYYTIDAWQQVAPAPINHIEGATAVVDGKIYIFSGFTDAALNPSNRTDVYNPTTNVWETIATPRVVTPFAASHIQAASDGQFIWVVGGFEGQHPGTAVVNSWRYDTVNDTWQAGPDLPAPRASGSVVRHGRTLHYISGLTTDRNIDQIEHFTLDLDNPAALWQIAPPMPQARNHMQAMTVGDYIYVIGGQFRHDTNPQDVALVHRFNTVSQQWEQVASLPTARSHFEPATFTYNGRIFGVGGRNNQNNLPALQTIVEYDPQADIWRTTGTMPVALIGPVANVVNGNLIITNGGFDYDQGQTNTWTTPLSVFCEPDTPVQRLVDFDISNSGILQSGGFGATGETVTWTISITNVGDSTENITFTNIVAPTQELIGTNFDRNRGDVSIDGRNIAIFAPGITPGDTISFTVQTRIVARSFDGTLTNDLNLQNTGETVTGIVRVLPPVTSLPQTGEAPIQRTLLMLTFGFILIAGGAFLTYRHQHIAK